MKWEARCAMTHSGQSVNNAAESILHFLRFSNTGFVDPHIVGNYSCLVNY